MSMEDEEEFGFASPACLMHEVDPSYMGVTPHDPPAPDVAAWRTTNVCG
ncbi:hypothetical protein NMA58_24985 (plasmid) [Rhizobium sp. YTUHZ045]